jgi:hypothetical protein
MTISDIGSHRMWREAGFRPYQNARFDRYDGLVMRMGRP